MGGFLVVLDTWPPADVPPAAKAWAEALGAAQMDCARSLRSCVGIPIHGVDEQTATKLAAALTRAGARAWPAAEALVARLPRPVTASRLEVDGPNLLAQVALTGPPEQIPLAKIVLVLPAGRLEQRTIGGGTKKTKVGIGTVALAATTGFGAGKVISAIRGKGKDIPIEIDTSLRALVEIVSIGPLKRLHGLANRLDYSVLGAEQVQGRRNFSRLLEQIAASTRPNLASRPALDRFIADGTVPDVLRAKDNNGLAAVSRWLLLRGAMRRFAARREG